MVNSYAKTYHISDNTPSLHPMPYSLTLWTAAMKTKQSSQCQHFPLASAAVAVAWGQVRYPVSVVVAESVAEQVKEDEDFLASGYLYR